MCPASARRRLWPFGSEAWWPLAAIHALSIDVACRDRIVVTPSREFTPEVGAVPDCACPTARVSSTRASRATALCRRRRHNLAAQLPRGFKAGRSRETVVRCQQCIRVSLLSGVSVWAPKSGRVAADGSLYGVPDRVRLRSPPASSDSWPIEVSTPLGRTVPR